MKHETALQRYGLFDAKVPRFTSYPPANWFTEDIDAPTVAGWLDRITDTDPLSLYAHVPFCKRLCWFCACRTQGTTSDAPLEGYVDRLITEFGRSRAAIHARPHVQRLHLGGGTPTILPSRLINRVLSAIESTFGLSALEEFSVEIDPTDVGPKRLAALRHWGMNRASLGIQDFAPQVQAAIGRDQSLDQTRLVVDQLRQLGVRGINFDLLYGLPFQTQASLTATLDDALKMQPDRIALFGYAHVPWMSKRQIMIPSDALPSPSDRYRLFEIARLRLLGEGFVQIGIDHFARPHDGLARAQSARALRRSFQGYTDDPARHLLGFGASAISSFPDGFAQNIPVTGRYAAAVETGALPVWRGYALSDDDRHMAKFVEDLMCYHRANVPAQATALRDRVDALAGEYADALDWSDEQVLLKRWAWPLVRILAARIALAVPETGDARRYSAAI